MLIAAGQGVDEGATLQQLPAHHAIGADCKRECELVLMQWDVQAIA